MPCHVETDLVARVCGDAARESISLVGYNRGEEGEEDLLPMCRPFEGTRRKCYAGDEVAFPPHGEAIDCYGVLEGPHSRARATTTVALSEVDRVPLQHPLQIPSSHRLHVHIVEGDFFRFSKV